MLLAAALPAAAVEPAAVEPAAVQAVAAVSVDGVAAGSEQSPPAAATDPFSALAAGPPSELTHEQMEEAVRTAYARAAAYMANAGAEVELDVGAVQTLEPREWDTILWTDIATYPEGWVIEVIGSNRSHRDDGVLTSQTRSYEPRWRERPSFDWSHPEMKWAAAATVREAVEFESQHDNPGWKRLFAITTYEVAVTFAGRSRQYQAAFFWYTEEGGGLALSALDRITQGIGEALSEPVPPEGLWFPAPERPPRLGLRSGRSAATSPSLQGITASTTSGPTCTSSSNTDSTFKNARGTNGHSSGYHEGYAGIQNSCSCDVACTSRCRGGFAGLGCADTGLATTYGKCHNLAQNQAPGSETRFDGHLSGATCATGYGCAQRTCVGSTCGCSVSIGVSASGASVTFSPSNAEWTAQLPHTTYCGACTEVPPVDDGSGTPDQEGTGDPGPSPGSPILIDLDGAGFQLTSLADGVWFDIDADGVLEKVSWTQAGVGDAFLFLDRNGNGIVDDGSELFGNFTSQPPSETPNGYLALAAFDENGDGILNSEDRVFWWLTLWVDSNHDGISQLHELVRVEEAGIESIDLGYVTSERQDRWGNKFRYQSLVATPTRMLQSVDVFFLVEENYE
jgi:hypothetical protein